MKYAVLIIDVQKGLFDTTPPPFEAAAVIGRINTVAGCAASAGIPVIIVQHEQVEGILAHGSSGWETADGLEIGDGFLRIRKTTPDSFLRTDLHKTLEGLGVEELFICGYASEFCVDTTARSAAAHGYRVTLLADAHTTHDKEHLSAASIREHHNATLPDITSFGVRIRAIPTEQACVVFYENQL